MQWLAKSLAHVVIERMCAILTVIIKCPISSSYQSCFFIKVLCTAQENLPCRWYQSRDHSRICKKSHIFLLQLRWTPYPLLLVFFCEPVNCDMAIRLPTSNDSSRLNASMKLRSFQWIALAVFLLCSLTVVIGQFLHSQAVIPTR